MSLVYRPAFANHQSCFYQELISSLFRFVSFCLDIQQHLHVHSFSLQFQQITTRMTEEVLKDDGSFIMKMILMFLAPGGKRLSMSITK